MEVETVSKLFERREWKEKRENRKKERGGGGEKKVLRSGKSKDNTLRMSRVINSSEKKHLFRRFLKGVFWPLPDLWSVDDEWLPGIADIGSLNRLIAEPQGPLTILVELISEPQGPLTTRFCEVKGPWGSEISQLRDPRVPKFGGLRKLCDPGAAQLGWIF